MITYQEEYIEDIVEEMKPLLYLHWEELANNKDVKPLDPDYESYIGLNRAGVIKMFTVRDEGKLIGYATFFVSNNLHYKTWKYASVDVYYLDMSYRKTGIGLEMFQRVEEWLKSLDVNAVVMMDKVNHSREKFFTKLGYKLIEQNYEKVF